MNSLVRVGCAGILLTALLAVPAASAQSEQLAKAIKLLNQQEYEAAQEALLKVDKKDLSEEEKARLDELLDLVPKAIQGHAQAVQNFRDAGDAYEAGRWQDADQLYAAVLENEFATPDLRQVAADQRERIAEKQGLAEAARPEGPVEETVPEEMPQDEVPGAVPPETTQPAQPEGPPPVPPPVAPPPEVMETPQRLTPADQLRIKEELLWQRALVKSQSLANEARSAMNQHDYAKATELADQALQVIEAARGYASPVGKYETARDAILRLENDIAASQGAYEEQQAQQARIEIAQRIATRQEQIEQQRQEKVQQLFRTARQLRQERRFGEAAEVLREILRIAPDNAQAQYQLDIAEDYESFNTQSQFHHDLYSQQRSALIKADEALIPWDVDVLYPKNWLELTAQRQSLGAAGGLMDIQDTELNRKMDETLPEVRFEEQPFEQVVTFLGDLTHVNIAVDWTDLENNGIDRERPVTVRLSGLSFKTVLGEVLAQVGGDVQLGYSVGEGLLRIASKDKLDRNKLIQIFDIRDLLVDVPRASKNTGFDIGHAVSQSGRGDSSGGRSAFFETSAIDDRDSQNDQNEGRGQQVQQILDIIRQTVEPNSWRETGGGDASIRELNGQLIVYNTSEAHQQVADLLRQLREQQSLQISVETRFLNVVSNFLEQFGVDLDFVFNSGTAGYDRVLGPDGAVLTDPFTGAPVLMDRRYSRIGSFATPPAFGTPLTPGPVPVQPYNQAAFVPPGDRGLWPYFNQGTPITAQQGSLSLTDVAGRPTGVPGSFASQAGLTPALNIAGSFLDNLQVDFLIRATQANARSSVVQAPRLVLFNGQASSISVGRARTYVSTLEPRLAEGAVGFAPQTNQANSGVSMWVEGTISADRRYVTLTLTVDQLDEPTFERFEVQRASGNSPGAFILLPDQAFTRLETTVSVPDGGTVLLGGLKQVGEVEIEAGVPVLSKIPILKRAFSNQQSVKDTRTLLILVKAKIIIQSEAEEEAFPTFSRSGG